MSCTFSEDSSGLQLLITFFVDYFPDELISCLVYEMPENGDQHFPKAQRRRPHSVLFCLRRKDMHFTVTEE